MSKETVLINRLNSKIDKSKKVYETPMACRWDNHGPVQFEDTNNTNEDTQLRTHITDKIKGDAALEMNHPSVLREETKPVSDNYEEVNHPDHYNQYDVEVIDMMERIFGKAETAIFCKLNAFKYRQRMGNKPGQSFLKDLAKEKWYLAKKKELEKKL